jgi:glutamate formiminotransferase/glutamate formiminotransferase/formiminotetrahydrofolate cyclodeaminase
MIECVVNVSEGRRLDVLDRLAGACGDALLDLHHDPDHHRSVFTLAGVEAVRPLARATVTALDLTAHEGAHPRLGTLDVVPFVPLTPSTFDEALAARDAFAEWAATTLALPCFLYGPERTLPEVRRRAFVDLAPDHGPSAPHPRAGAVAVGARPVLIAYNLWLREPDLARARELARQIRGPAVRALALQVGDEVQVSMNLVAPDDVGPAEVYDVVSASVDVARAELVGLVPAAIVDRIDPRRWAQLDLDPERTIEARLASRGSSG